MRGDDPQQNAMFSYISPEQRVPQDHPLRRLRPKVDAVLKNLSRRFDQLYAPGGRPSIAPEKLLRALLLQVLYTVRSERLLMEQLDYNLLFRWFVGLTMDDALWEVTVFTKNRQRLLEGDVADAFFEQVLALARQDELLSDEHFSVDGTLIEAWAGQKSFKSKGGAGSPPADDPGNPTVDFRGEKRSHETHQSTTDPEARLCKKARGQEAKPGYLGHLLMENRHGLAVGVRLTLATGTAEAEAALEMLTQPQRTRRITVAADKKYDTHDFVTQARERHVTPQVAQNTERRGGSAMDGRTTRHPGYAMSQRIRKRLEEIFGWLKTVGLMRKVRHRGRERVAWMLTWAVAIYDLVRICNLEKARAEAPA